MAIGSGRAKYARPEQGPFKCAHCEYFDGTNKCRQTKVVQDAEDGFLVLKDGKAIVSPNGCCNQYEPR